MGHNAYSDIYSLLGMSHMDERPVGQLVEIRNTSSSLVH